MELDQPIGRGNTAEIYRYKGKILKRFKPDLPPDEAGREAEKQQWAYACGLPVPKVHGLERIDGQQAIVMEYVPGPTLGEQIRHEPGKVAYYLSQAAEMQIRIHGVKASSWPAMTERLAIKIAASGLTLRWQEELLRRLQDQPEGTGLCHGDFHVYNLIQTDTELFVIDWVDSTRGDVRADVCRSYILYHELSEEIADLYLQLYCEKSRFSKDEILSWLPILAGARLSENISPHTAETWLKLISSRYSL
ncbi:MAG: aminoglycoside phosphotransferase family protein [Paenibacillus sp.]|uniref:phosphotransferase family protein n=2 Tax=Paenibacillus TaxID=44249 RepID=UPI002911710F|nr:aminoglycoside phosphotransferase family protein [Paenibacillus sp.]MDU4694651.1 aminoglycoside phosphotransferase family protein [Paenibacillus sp.]